MTTTTIERARSGDVALLRITGDVTSASDTELTEGFGAAVDDGARAVALDFSAMEYMNSGGIGLLVTLTPALLTRWMHAPGWHAALLLSECVVCVLWGISQRIRVFVAGGLGTILLYAASVSLGILPDTLTTILALLAGVGLFIFGFYALTHQEMMKQVATKIQQRWTIWHSWR